MKSAAVSLGLVDRPLWGLDRRPPTIDPFDNYEQWQQAKGDKAGKDNSPSFWIAPGFEISLVRKAQDGRRLVGQHGVRSPRAADHRPRGEGTLADDARSQDGRAVSRVETINDELQECRGLLYADGALYANANNSKGMFRLRDIDGDDKFDEVEAVAGISRQRWPWEERYHRRD